MKRSSVIAVIALNRHFLFPGKISFILVRVKIKHMEIDLIRREQTGSGPSNYMEQESIGKYEIMDGGPAKGEVIPIRLFLKSFQGQPTMKVLYQPVLRLVK